MHILDSLEVRWFLPDSHPMVPVVGGWFAANSAEGSRTDDYLLTGRSDFGFKVRGVVNQATKVETKFRSGALGEVQVAPQVIGNLERWSKLALALDDATITKDGDWLALEKVRYLRKFAFIEGKVSEVGRHAEPRPSSGCSVELTRLRHLEGDGSVAQLWTFGFEAFGPTFLLLEILQATCQRVLGAHGLPLRLSSQFSRSYPEWIVCHQRASSPFLLADQR